MRGQASRFPTSYLLPALLLAALVWGAPLIYSFAISFSDATPGADGSFTGAANYLKAFSDPRFGNSLFVSLVFATGAMVLGVGLGFGIAVALRRNERARAAAQTALLLPWCFPSLRWR